MSSKDMSEDGDSVHSAPVPSTSVMADVTQHGDSSNVQNSQSLFQLPQEDIQGTVSLAVSDLKQLIEQVNFLSAQHYARVGGIFKNVITKLK